MLKKEILVNGQYSVELSPIEFVKLQCFVEFFLNSPAIVDRSESMDSWVCVAKSFVAL